MKKELFKFECGSRVVDIITGYAGIVGGRTHYLTECIQYGIIAESLTKDKKTYDWLWFDESRLKLVKKNAIKVDDKSDPAGPAPSAPEC